MTMKTIKAPITVMYDGEYRPPGTEITLPEADANALIARHGMFDDDPANAPTGRAKAADDASLAALNTYHNIFNKF